MSPSLPPWHASSCLPHVGQIDQIDHDLDHLDPNLPLRYVVQDISMVPVSVTPAKHVLV